MAAMKGLQRWQKRLVNCGIYFRVFSKVHDLTNFITPPLAHFFYVSHSSTLNSPTPSLQVIAAVGNRQWGLPL